MKKLGLFILCFFLVGCEFNYSFKEFQNYTLDTDEHLFIQKDGYYKPDNFNDDFTFTEITRDWPYYSTKRINILPTGERKLLVIPVDFSDRACSSLPNGCEKTRIQIQNAFFGVNSKNTYRSVASYFNESSFGKLHLSGEVSQWYTLDYSVNDLKNTSTLSNYVKEVVDSYKKDNPNYKMFDTDKDGFLDGVVIIYAYESQSSTNMWAFESSTTEASPDTLDPKVKSFIWASYDFMNLNSSSSKVDAHTYIHETGHLLGLFDYYSDNRNQIYQPLGGMDMMDYNIGDHNTFSKMLLDWTRPYVVEDDCEITIGASYKNGDCILIPAGSWNKTPMDEYLLIELYSPKGLNKYDSKVTYTNGKTDFSLMNKRGIKIYHVDARLSYYRTFVSEDQDPFIGYLGDPNLQETLDYYDQIGQKYYRKITHSNNLNNSHNNIPLIEIFDRHGTSYLKNGNIFDNDSMFIEGDQILSFTFNNGSKLEYTIEIAKINNSNETATIRLKKHN